MSKKRKQNISSLTRAQHYFEKGNYRQCIEETKQLLKKDANDQQIRELCLKAYKARIIQLAEKGLLKEALALRDIVLSRFKGYVSVDFVLEKEIRAVSGDIKSIIEQFDDPRITRRDHRQLVLQLRQHVKDPGLLLTYLPENHSLYQDVHLINELFAAVVSGPISSSQELLFAQLERIPRASPLASWRFLIQAMKWFYEGEYSLASKYLQSISQNDAVVSMKRVLLCMMNEFPYQELSSLEKSAIEKVSNVHEKKLSELSELVYQFDALLEKFKTRPNSKRRGGLEQIAKVSLVIFESIKHLSLPIRTCIRINLFAMIAKYIFPKGPPTEYDVPKQVRRWLNSLFDVLNEHPLHSLYVAMLLSDDPYQIAQALYGYAQGKKSCVKEQEVIYWYILKDILHKEEELHSYFGVEDEEELLEGIDAGYIPEFFDRSLLFEKLIATRICPAYYEAYLDFLMKHGSRTQQRGLIDQWMDRFPADPVPYEKEIRICLQNSSTTRGMSMLEKLRQLKPHYPAINKIESRLYHAHIEKNLLSGKNRCCLPYIEKLRDFVPNEALSYVEALQLIDGHSAIKVFQHINDKDDSSMPTIALLVNHIVSMALSSKKYSEKKEGKAYAKYKNNFLVREYSVPTLMQCLIEANNALRCLERKLLVLDRAVMDACVRAGTRECSNELLVSLTQAVAGVTEKGLEYSPLVHFLVISLAQNSMPSADIMMDLINGIGKNAHRFPPFIVKAVFQAAWRCIEYEKRDEFKQRLIANWYPYVFHFGTWRSMQEQMNKMDDNEIMGKFRSIFPVVKKVWAGRMSKIYGISYYGGSDTADMYQETLSLEDA